MDETVLSEDKKVVYVFFNRGFTLPGSYIMVQHNRNEELEICLYEAKCVTYQIKMDVGK